MRFNAVPAVLLSAIAAAVCAVPAGADTADASCVVRKSGESRDGQSGACTFSQRQGYIDLDLRNGDKYSLSPGNKPDQFKDQKGRKVVRTSAAGNAQVYKWEGGRKITVTFAGSTASSGGGGDRIAVSDMPRYCAGAASGKFQQSPKNITTQAATPDQQMYSVWGQYPASPSPQVFICTFSGEGRFVGVDKHRP
jgi:hypothetical protein